MSNEKYALVVELQDEALSEIDEAKEILAKKFQIDYIKRSSPCAHITISSGFIVLQEDEFLKSLNELCKGTEIFSVEGNGLGVFLTSSPVIHMRWKKNEKLIEFRDKTNKLMRWAEMNGLVAAVSDDIDWIPKTTIAYSDTKISNLSEVLESLSNRDFKNFAHLRNFALYRFITGGSETKVATFRFTGG